ncbi:MAG: hypothetical protein CL858_07795 [Cupriavidus sp.]|nr:hypothetical protein [Cupriavidus sp.]
MPDIRYFLKDRDPTSAGGMLIAVSRSFTHHGVSVGLEGDMATCPACKSSGPVYNDCFPTFDVVGKQALVNGARVYCKCPVHPTVFNTQNDSTVEVNRRASYGQTKGRTKSIFATSNPRYDQQIQILDGSTGKPLPGVRYRLTGSAGTFEGRTDNLGMTERMASDDAVTMKLEIFGAKA